MKIRLSPSCRVHAARGCPSVVGSSSSSAAREPTTHQSCGRSPARSHAPDPTLASPAKQSARRLSSSSSRRARAAPGQPLGHPILYQPCSALGERQLEQGHGGVHHAGPRRSGTHQGRKMRPSCPLPAASLPVRPAQSAVRLCAGPRPTGQCMRRRGGPSTAASAPRSRRAPPPSGIAARSPGSPLPSALPAGAGQARPRAPALPLQGGGPGFAASGPPIAPALCTLGNRTTLSATSQAEPRCWEQRGVYSGRSRTRQTQQGVLVLSNPWLLARSRSSGT